MYLYQTNLEVNESEIFISNLNGIEFYKTKCKKCIISINEFNLIGRNCSVYGLKLNHKLRKSLFKKGKENEK